MANIIWIDTWLKGVLISTLFLLLDKKYDLLKLLSRVKSLVMVNEALHKYTLRNVDENALELHMDLDGMMTED